MKKLHKNRKLLIISCVIILLLVVAGATFYYSKHKNNTRDVDPTTGDAINYGPPTKQDTSNIDNEIKSDQDAQNSTKPKGKAVSPMIVSYGQTKNGVEVSSRIPGIMEDGGTCTLTLTMGSDKVTVSKKGTANVSDTSCGFITISNSKLSPGNWSATVSYLSDKYSGVSDNVAIEVK